MAIPTSVSAARFADGEIDAAAEFYLLGCIDFDQCLRLQQRLVYEAGGGDDGRIDVILCEHPPLITVGRGGSRAQIRLTDAELRRRQLAVKWVSRGGGCLPHAPGQLAVYVIAPLARHGWTVGEYLRRLQTGIAGCFARLNYPVTTVPNRVGAWGRTGQLAAAGVAVRNWITSHGFWINVHPPMQLVSMVKPMPVRPLESTTVGGGMGCLLAERRQAARMTAVRSAVVESLVVAFGCRRHHIYSSHPLLLTGKRSSGEHASRTL